MEYIENKLTYEDYVSLRSSVGWNNFAEEQVRKGIARSLYAITVEDNYQTVAMDSN